MRFIKTLNKASVSYYYTIIIIIVILLGVDELFYIHQTILQEYLKHLILLANKNQQN
jgi:uncharacterized membrane protein